MKLHNVLNVVSQPPGKVMVITRGSCFSRIWQLPPRQGDETSSKLTRRLLCDSSRVSPLYQHRCGRTVLRHHSFRAARCGTMRLHLLLLSWALATLSPARAEVEDPSADAQEKEDVKPDEIAEEKGIMVLHQDNFARALSENKFLLVEFYAPWCGHCQALEPEYAEAAGILKTESSDIRLAKVDATEQKGLAEEFQISSFPILKLFKDGDRKTPIEFTGKRKALGIVQWLKRRTGPVSTVLESVASAQDLIDANNVTVIGFFTDMESEDVKAFNETALDRADITFGITSSPDIFQNYEVSKNRIVLFKKFDEKRADLEMPEDAQLSKEMVDRFIRVNALERVVEFNEQNAHRIFDAKINHHLLLFINKTVGEHLQLLESFRGVASEFTGQVLFILIDVSPDHEHVLSYFGLSSRDAPTVRLVDIDTAKKYSLGEQAITAESLSALCRGVLDRTVKPHLMSQEVPEDWDKKPVKVLVGKNFEQVAFAETKNVFVEFYAPWCAHCKELAPVWEQLGEKYKDHENIIIANMDATANDVEGLTVSGFPTIKYFPAGTERKIVDYDGRRDLETFSKFLDNGGELPEEEEEVSEESDTTTDIPTQANETSKDEL
uniref:Protein disulfide-isomerase n=1 Tax=Lepisosteus oculatus TaxID=7918 RepID=W5MGU2_LEPOC|nr:PREDICTED: protein disulfide-isomerase A2 [Lepisosteus oculatus]